MTELNVCWFTLCTCFCTKQMLIDALVFGVYKCVSSLLNVSVLPLLELDFKRVYFIQMGADRYMMSVLRLPQEHVMMLYIFRYLFLLLNEEWPSLKRNPCGCSCTSIRDWIFKGATWIKDWKTVFCYTANAKLVSKIELFCLHGFSDILLMGGCLINLTFHELRWHLLDLWDVHWKRSIRVFFFTIIDWGCKALLQGKRKIARFVF